MNGFITQELIPSFTNLPVFYTVTVTLLLMVLLAVISLYINTRGESSSRRTLFWLKLIISIPLLLLGAVWMYLGAYMLGFVALIGGSSLLLALTLTPIAIYAITTWGVIRWIRNKRFANASVILVIVTFAGTLYTYQRAWICEPLAHSSVGIAQLCTAELYETGTGGVIAHDTTAREWYRNAAAKGSAVAQYWVGMDARDIDERKKWLTFAANQGHAPAAYQLFLLLRPEDERGLKWLQFAVGENYPPALYRLGLLHSNGYRVAHKLDRTRELWPRSAEAGYITAMRGLSLAYARGVLFNIDLDESRMWEQRAIAASDNEKRKKLPVSEQHFAQTWATQLNGLRNKAKEINANNPEALRQLSREILLSAKDDPVQRKRGVLILEQGAAKGDPDSQYIVANYYLGLEAPAKKETSKGLTWLTKAAKNDHHQALRRLIDAHKEGKFGLTADLYKAKYYSEQLFAVLEEKDVPHNNSSWNGPVWDYQDTMKQIKRLESLPLPRDELQTNADANDPEAQYYLAKDIAFYERDYEKSQTLLKASAHGGFPQAQFELATRTFQRKRTNDEEKQAITWFYTAANNGHRGAMVWLGKTYISGFALHNIDRNYYEARIWLERAIEGKDDIVYKQQTSPTKGWQISVESVNNHLHEIPDYMTRLNLEGLNDQHRTAAINEWYEREQNTLNEKLELARDDEVSKLSAALDALRSQQDVLLKTNRG